MMKKGIEVASEELDGIREGVFHFAGFSFDSRKLELRRGAQLQELDAMTRDVLLVLLRARGRVVTRGELLDEVWVGKFVEDSSLSVAVGRLRKSLGAEAKKILVTVPKAGYKIGVETAFTPTEDSSFSFGLSEGQVLQRRPGVNLSHMLGRGGFGEVWLVQAGDAEPTVFKFAAGGRGLRALKRELAANHVLESAGHAQPARILSSDFECEPYYLETAYIGPNLLEWTRKTSGLGALSHDQRVEFAASICRQIVKAHRVGVFHNGLKPTNILIDESADGVSPHVIDYGNSVLSDLSLLGSVTLAGTDSGDASSSGGTILYMAPELRHGAAATATSDVYSLGILLYEIVIGDLSRTLASGWEAEIDDEVLTTDIRDSTQGDPSKRIQTVDELAQRLSSIKQRRVAAQERAQQQARAAFLEAREAQAQARRPWVLAAFVSLIVGLFVSSALYVRADRLQGEAERNLDVAEALNGFLIEGVFSSANPERGGNPQVTLKDAVDQGREYLEALGKVSPDVEQQVHFSLGQLYFELGDYKNAASEFVAGAVENAGVLRSVTAQAWAVLAYAFGGQKEEAVAGLNLLRDQLEESQLRSDELAFLLELGGVQIQLMETAWDQLPPQLEPLMIHYESRLAELPVGVRRFVYSAAFNTNIKIDRFDQAQAVLDRWQKQRGLDPRSNHYELAIIEKQRGRLLSRSGQQELAIPALERSYQAFVSSLGSDHIETTNTLHSLAVARLESDQVGEAVVDMKQVVERHQRELGATHPYTMSAYGDLAAALMKSGHPEQVVQQLEPVLPLAIETNGAQHMTSILSSYNLVEAYIATEELEDARRWFVICRDSGNKTFPADSQWTGRIAFLEGSLALAEGDRVEARAQLSKASLEFDNHPEVDEASRQKLSDLLKELRRDSIG